MPFLYTCILAVHVIAGFAALGVGTIIGLRRKGNGTHRRLGRWFVRFMSVMATTAVILAIIRPNPFLLLVAVFSGYQAIVGGRSFGINDRSRRVDVILACSLCLVGMSQFVVAFHTDLSDVIIPLVFAALILVQGGSDLYSLLHHANARVTRRAMIARHIAQMGGASIATWTAFLVNNAPLQLGVLWWLLPSAVGTVLLVRSIRRYAPVGAAMTQPARRQRPHESHADLVYAPDGTDVMGG